MPSGVSQPLGEPSRPLLLLRTKMPAGSSSPASELPPGCSTDGVQQQLGYWALLVSDRLHMRRLQAALKV